MLMGGCGEVEVVASAGDVDEDGYSKNLNGICAGDGYIMAKIYYEPNIDNLFFRNESLCESYQPPWRDLNKIETHNIPVFSFRYKPHFPNQKKKNLVMILVHTKYLLNVMKNNINHIVKKVNLNY